MSAKYFCDICEVELPPGSETADMSMSFKARVGAYNYMSSYPMSYRWLLCALCSNNIQNAITELKRKASGREPASSAV